jgi:hypothetical protein
MISLFIKESKIPPPLEADNQLITYILLIIAMGGIASIASLLSSEAAISMRAIIAYLMSGLVASGVIVTLLVEQYGVSWFMVGVSILAGYKAIDFLAIAGVWLKNLTGKYVAK